MVRRAQLQVDGYVFVLPEQVEGVAEYPFYAKVTALTSDIATIRSIGSDEPVTCNLDVAIALVGVDGRLAQLQLEDRVVLVEPSCLTPVAPVVALLLLRVPLHASMTRDGLMDMQTSILGRNLDGTASAPASNAIPSILDGFAAPPDMPDGHSDRQWIDPRTGRQCRFRLQHVVDYAFVVDGNQSAPPSLRLSIGHSFCQEPRQLEREPAPDVGRARELVSSSNMTPTEQADSIISLFAQEEPASPVQADHFPERDVRRDRRPHLDDLC
ncbi:Hypothetical protein PHPALM_9579 [Phytophthora palmivora]|uniref:Uncharacterized protein n=1 Tax=Phytophthora palmivora TaxID=4796 RepID=A0A2P4Y6X6_9STRA|nr:Hypothetical protein PHPALM_9579 [Phytophthora palmivora]